MFIAPPLKVNYGGQYTITPLRWISILQPVFQRCYDSIVTVFYWMTKTSTVINQS